MTVNKKKFTLLVLSFLTVCFLLVKPVLAIKEIEDYLFQLEKYREEYQDFSQARDKYLKYKTLKSKNQAVEKTNNLLVRRGRTLRAYFLALIWKLRSTPGIGGEDYRQRLVSLLDKEVNWLANQNEQLKNLPHPALEDLFVISDRFEDKETFFQQLSYRALVIILTGKVRHLHSESVAITNLLADQISQVPEATKAGELRNWLRELENKNYLAQKEIEIAESQQEELTKKKEPQLSKIYFQIKLNLERSKEYLNQAALFEKEILDLLKK